MATNKNTLSVYADEKLLAALNSFKDSGNHKSLNVAIVSILEEKLFGDALDNAQSKVSSTLDIEGIVNEAISSKLSDIKTEIEESYSAGYRGIAANFNDLLQQRDLEIEELRAAIAAITSEAMAISKKPLMLSQNQKVIAIQKLQQAS